MTTITIITAILLGGAFIGGAAIEISHHIQGVK